MLSISDIDTVYLTGNGALEWTILNLESMCFWGLGGDSECEFRVWEDVDPMGDLKKLESAWTVSKVSSH